MEVGAEEEEEEKIDEMVVAGIAEALLLEDSSKTIVDALKDGSIIVTTVVLGPFPEAGSEFVTAIVSVPEVGMTVVVELLELGAMLEDVVLLDAVEELLVVLDGGTTDEDGVASVELVAKMLLDVELDCRDDVLEVEEEEEEYA